MEKNYEWLVEDINDSYRLKVFYKDSDGNKRYATYVATNINRLDNLEIEAVSGNVQDIENLISGMVRFVNEIDESKILDIPLRNIYMLSALHGDKQYSREVNFKELQGFTPVDIETIEVHYLNEKSKELEEIEIIAKDYFGMGMQDKFNSMKRVNELNEKRKVLLNHHTK